MLLESKKLKVQGFTNEDVKKFVETGLGTEAFERQQKKKEYKKNIIASYNEYKVKKGSSNMLVYELQKLLNANGFAIKVDGVFNVETSGALKEFEEKSGFYPDGELDLLTLNRLLGNETKKFKTEGLYTSSY